VQQARAVVINRAIHARERTASEYPLSVAVYAGLEDGIVRKESALDVFPDDSTRVVRGDHFTIIQPLDHRDPNYLSASGPKPATATDPGTLMKWGWKDVVDSPSLE
jgi:hypothetical protein